MINYKGVDYTDQQIKLMREWVNDCQWDDLEVGESKRLPAIDILKGVDKYYEGGLKAFIEEDQ